MRIPEVMILFIAASAEALVQPSPFPARPVRCTYEGVFPGSTRETRWELVTEQGGTWSMNVTDAEAIRGVVAHDLGARAQKVVHWSITGTESGAGPLQQSRVRLVAQVEAADGQSGRYVSTVDTETVCPGMPRIVRAGERWTCRERVRAGWQLETGAGAADSGEQHVERTLAIQYLRDQATDLAGGVTGALIEVQDGEGGKEHHLLDPVEPWCALSQQRIRLDRVVGTDRLVERVLSAAEKPAEPEPSEVDSQRIPVWALAGLGIACVAVAVVVARARRRSSAS